MIEKILVKLEADVKDYIKDMEKAKKKNEETGKSGGGLAGMLGKVGMAARAAAVPIAGLAAGVGAVGAALSAMALSAASNRREFERFARQAKTTTGEFAALAFATKQYGLDAVSVADITKDLSDRFGEFATAGTGTFQDFADVMGLSAEEARKASIEFGKMSGQDAIQSMVTQMENAGASGDQMTFVLESMGSELSRLLPLFTKNGEELNRLTGRYSELNAQLAVSDQQAEELKGLSESFDLLQGTIGKASDAIGARFAPYLNSLISSVIDVVPAATNTLIDFFNTFVDAENLKSIRDIDAQLESSHGTVEKLQGQIENFGLQSLRKGVLASDQKAILERQLEEEQNRLLTLELQKEQIEKQNEQYRLQAALKREANEIGVGGGATSNLDKEDQEKKDAELQAFFDATFERSEMEREAEQLRLDMLAQFALTREERLLEQYARELELLNEFQEATGASDEELYARRLEAARKFNNDLERLNKSQVKSDEDTTKKKEATMEDGLRMARMVGNAMFEDNKAVRAGLVIADTAAGIMKAVADYGMPVAIPFVAATAAMGLAQLANIQGSSKGGGSISGGSGGGGTAITNAPEEFRSNTTSLEVGATIEGEYSTTQRVSLDVDDSEDFIDSLADRISQRVKAG